MANKAYVLIETAVGRSREVTLELQKCEWVEFAERVVGPYDIVAIACGHDPGEAERLICDALSSLAGVIRVVVCPISAGAKPVLPASGSGGAGWGVSAGSERRLAGSGSGVTTLLR
jgi:hypothetical protein